MDLKKLLIRAVSGLIYIALIICCCLWGVTGVAVLAAVLGILATLEFKNMVHEFAAKNIPCLLLDIAGVVALALGAFIIPLIFWIVIMICRIVEELYSDNPNPLHNLAYSFMTQIYIGVPLGLMVGLGTFFGMHTTLILAIFILIWANDTGAYLTGSLIGHTPLFKRISPKKTWEGFVGGLVLNIIIGLIICFYGSHAFDLNLTWQVWVGLSFIVTIFGTWGDLAESMMKRTLNLKDSSRLIPGHGGILDRIDSSLMVMPAAFVYFVLLELSRIQYLIVD